MDAEPVGDEDDADHEHEGEGKHFDGGVGLDETGDGPDEEEHESDGDENGGDHDGNEGGHADGGDDGIEAEDDIESDDLSDDGGEGGFGACGGVGGAVVFGGGVDLVGGFSDEEDAAGEEEGVADGVPVPEEGDDWFGEPDEPTDGPEEGEAGDEGDDETDASRAGSLVLGEPGGKDSEEDEVVNAEDDFERGEGGEGGEGLGGEELFEHGVVSGGGQRRLCPMTTLDPSSPAVFRRAASAVVELLGEYLEHAGAGTLASPVLPASDPKDHAAYWGALMRESPSPERVFAEMLERSHHLHDRRYMGHQVAVPLALSAVADLFSSVLNNGMAVYEMGPVGAATERAVLRWMQDALGYGSEAEGVFTSGGSLGNLTALLTARQARAGWDVWAEGNAGGPPLSVLVSEEAHYCVARAAQVMGLGTGGVALVPTDEGYRVTAEGLEFAFERSVNAGRRPFAVVASCCTTSTGSYDPIGVTADFAERRGLWLHVDGAHGASVAISPSLRQMVAGIERADSVVWDAHKMLGVASLSTAVLFREQRPAHVAFAQRAAYLLDDAAELNWWDSARRTIECTRRPQAIPLYLLLACCGEGVLAAHVERLHRMAKVLAEIIRADGDFELAIEPESNIVCFRWTGGGGEDLDAVQRRIRSEIVRSGEFFLVQTTLRDGVYLRCTVMNPATDESDVLALLSAVRSAAGAVRPGRA